MKTETTGKCYLASFAVTFVAAAIAVFAINSVVDPLWYFNGNQVAPKNFVFNERLAKMNRLLPHLDDYDCLIFGNSRATLLPETQFANNRCFNLSFSNGLVGDYVEYARYLSERGVRPKLVILQVDAENFSMQTPVQLVPDFVELRESPPSVLDAYFTADALDFSVRTLFDRSPFPRYYDEDFVGAVRLWESQYIPERAYVSDRRYNILKNIEVFDEIQRIFDSSDIVGYAPPLSIWRLSKYDGFGSLDEYISAIHTASQHFPRFADFSFPSLMTSRLDNTYDGSHYYPEALQSIIDWVEYRNTQSVSDPSGYGRAEYIALFRRALTERLEGLQ